VTGAYAAQFVFVVLLLVVVAFGALAQRLRVPYPLVLFVAGLLVSFIPGLPSMTLDPDVIFFVVLPPLLYAAAWNTPWREFSHNLVSITSLAVGLVAFTVAGVAAVAGWIAPGFDWRIGFVLGAVVSPTDAIAATSIARNMGLPRRIVDVLEGESLVNDATGLLAVEMGVLLLTWGEIPAATFVLFRLGYLVACGIGVGLALGVVVDWFERRIDDGPIEIAISVLVPYGAYLIADAIHASGVLAVVAAGLYLGRRSTHFFSPTVRLQAYSVWNALTFTLNGLVFVLIGLQLPVVVAGIQRAGLGTMLLAGAALSAVVIALRVVWVFPGARLSYFIRHRFLRQADPIPTPRQLLIVGWAGMRGVIALAAAMALPRTLAEGTALPQKNAIVFFTFCVIVATLLFQGLTLPPLIRLLGLETLPGPDCEEKEARRIVLQSALSRLEQIRAGGSDALAPVYDDLAQHYRQRLASLEVQGTGDGDVHRTSREISRELLRVERESAIQLRDERRINDEVLREIEHDLDLREARMQPSQRQVQSKR
jgi:CPA1 family monovalent cation:H+ antiporter